MEAPINSPTFDTFMVGKSNELAYATALAFAAKPEQKYNPLFIFGDKGLGKTHLLHAIGHYVLSENHDARVYYCTGDSFSNEVITAIKMDDLQSFHNKTRNVDLFLMDDIQFISGRESLEEQFFHLYNYLYSEGKQMVVTSTKPPREIPNLAERLRWRLEAGLIIDILQPDHELCAAFLRKRAHDHNVIFPDDVIDFIAQATTPSFYELEYVFTILTEYARQHQEDISMELFDIMIISSPPKPPNDLQKIEQIIKVVSSRFDVSEKDILLRNKRDANTVNARNIAVYLVREMTELSVIAIAKVFGNSDHGTVHYRFSLISKKMEEDILYREMVEDIKREIRYSGKKWSFLPSEM